MVGREVDWPPCVVLGRFWDLCCRSWGQCWPFWAALGPRRQFWAALGASIGGVGCTSVFLGAYVGDLGPLLGLYWRSWPALGAAVCDPGPLLGPIWAVWGRKMRRTWLMATLKCVYFFSGGLGVGLQSLSGPMLSVLGRSWDASLQSSIALGAFGGGLGRLEMH